MAKQENEYQRLPGRSSFFLIIRSKLYLGKDHLLRVNSNGWTENYRRFYFSDIQSVVVSLTKGQWVWVIVHLIFCALFILWLLWVENTPGRVILGCIALFFGVKVLTNVLAGRTCITKIQTRVGTERLPSPAAGPRRGRLSRC